MQMFKVFFQLLKAYKGTIILYGTIFLSLALVMTLGVNGSKSRTDSFTSKELSVAIINEDGSSVGESLKDYFKEENELIELENDEDIIFDEIYWRTTDYVLIIPKGFEDSLLDGEPMELESMKVPGLFEASSFESQLDLYFSKLTALLEAGYELDEAQDMMMELKKENVDTKIASFVNANAHDATTGFFNYAPYLFITLGISGVGMILVLINQKEVKDRTECGAMSLAKRTAGITTGILLFGVIMLVVVVLAVMILSKGALLTDVRFPYFLFNLVGALVFGMSLGFFAGNIANSIEAITGLCNVFSLALSFLGGVFVPLEFFSEGIEKVARFIPVYWYVVNNEMIGAMRTPTDTFLKDVFMQGGIVYLYAVAIFAITLVLLSVRRKRK